MISKRRKIADARIHGVGRRSFLCANDAGDLELLGAFDQILHVRIVFCHVLPHIVRGIALIRVARMDESELHPEEVVIGPLELIAGVFDLFAVHDLVDHVFEFLRIAEAERIYDVVVQLVLAVEHEEKLVVFFRPSACKRLVLRFEKLLVVHHLEEDIVVHHREVGLLEAAHVRLHDGARADAKRTVFHVRRIYVDRQAVRIVVGVEPASDLAHVRIKVFPEGSEVVGTDACEHVGHDALLVYVVAGIFALGVLGVRHECSDHGAHVGGLRLYRERIG